MFTIVYLSHLQQISNYQAQVHIFKQFHKNIIGKGGATIRAIRDETDTKIELPSESSDSDVITITGKQENVEKARARIEDIQKELVNNIAVLLFLFCFKIVKVIVSLSRFCRYFMQLLRLKLV